MNLVIGLLEQKLSSNGGTGDTGTTAPVHTTGKARIVLYAWLNRIIQGTVWKGIPQAAT